MRGDRIKDVAHADHMETFLRGMDAMNRLDAETFDLFKASYTDVRDLGDGRLS